MLLKIQGRLKLAITISIILLIQILIVVIFLYSLYTNAPIDEKKLSTVTVTVDNIKRVYIFSENKLFIYSNDTYYVVAERGSSSGDYSNTELEKEINVGDVLELTYFERRDIYGLNKWVVEAHSEDKTYLTLGNYEKNKVTPVVFYVIYAFVEVIFLLVSAAFIVEFKRKTNPEN